MHNSDNVIGRIDELIAEEEAENSLLDVMGDYRSGSLQSYAGAYDFTEGNPPQNGFIATRLGDPVD